MVSNASLVFAITFCYAINCCMINIFYLFCASFVLQLNSADGPLQLPAPSPQEMELSAAILKPSLLSSASPALSMKPESLSSYDVEALKSKKPSRSERILEEMGAAALHGVHYLSSTIGIGNAFC